MFENYIILVAFLWCSYFSLVAIIADSNLAGVVIADMVSVTDLKTNLVLFAFVRFPLFAFIPARAQLIAFEFIRASFQEHLLKSGKLFLRPILSIRAAAPT